MDVGSVNAAQSLAWLLASFVGLDTCSRNIYYCDLFEVHLLNGIQISTFCSVVVSMLSNR